MTTFVQSPAPVLVNSSGATSSTSAGNGSLASAPARGNTVLVVVADMFTSDVPSAVVDGAGNALVLAGSVTGGSRQLSVFSRNVTADDQAGAQHATVTWNPGSQYQNHWIHILEVQGLWEFNASWLTAYASAAADPVVSSSPTSLPDGTLMLAALAGYWTDPPQATGYTNLYNTDTGTDAYTIGWLDATSGVQSAGWVGTISAGVVGLFAFDDISTSPIIEAVFGDFSANDGGEILLNGRAVGNGGVGPVTYQWQTDTGGGWADISGATSETCSITGINSGMIGHKWRIVATDSKGATTSGAATLTAVLTGTPAENDAIGELAISEFYIPSTGGGGVTGTANITEAPDTVAATGTVSIGATASITEAADTLSASAAVAVQATGTITEAGDTLSGAAAVAIQATAGVTEDPDTLTATGTIGLAGVTATLNVTEAPDTLTAAGTVLITAAATATESADTAAGSGAVPVAAVATVAEVGDTVSAGATVEIDQRTATATVNEAPDTAQGAASVPVAATSAHTQAADSAAAAASVALLLQAAISEAGDSAAGEAISEVFYSITETQARLIYQIAMLHGLDPANPLTVSATGRSAGTLIQTITGSDDAVIIQTVSAPPMSGTAGQWIDALAALHGLTDDLIVTSTSRMAGGVSQTLATDGTTTTVESA